MSKPQKPEHTVKSQNTTGHKNSNKTSQKTWDLTGYKEENRLQNSIQLYSKQTRTEVRVTSAGGEVDPWARI